MCIIERNALVSIIFSLTHFLGSTISQPNNDLSIVVAVYIVNVYFWHKNAFYNGKNYFLLAKKMIQSGDGAGDHS